MDIVTYCRTTIAQGTCAVGYVLRDCSFEPFTENMTVGEKSHILGIHANLWTEYISENSHLEYMLLPRMSVLSEIQWCPQDGKDYERFLENMKMMAKIYDALGYNYAKHIF